MDMLANCTNGQFCPGYDCSSGPDMERVFFYDSGGSYQEGSNGFSLYNACNCSSFHKDTHHSVSLEVWELEGGHGI